MRSGLLCGDIRISNLCDILKVFPSVFLFICPKNFYLDMKQFYWRLITHLWKWYFLWIYAYKISYKIIRCIRKLFNSICVMKFLRISEKNWIRLPNAEISYSKVPISIKDLGFCTFYQIFVNQFFFGCSQRAWITWNSFTSSIPYLSSLWYRKALIDQSKMSSVI